MGTFGAIMAGLLPSVGVGLVFWFAMRKILRADRNEREAQALLDAQEAARYVARQQKAPGAS